MAGCSKLRTFRTPWSMGITDECALFGFSKTMKNAGGYFKAKLIYNQMDANIVRELKNCKRTSLRRTCFKFIVSKKKKNFRFQPILSQFSETVFLILRPLYRKHFVKIRQIWPCCSEIILKLIKMIYNSTTLISIGISV